MKFKKLLIVLLVITEIVILIIYYVTEKDAGQYHLFMGWVTSLVYAIKEAITQ